MSYELMVHPKVETFITKLQKPTIAKVLRTLDLLEKYSVQLGMPHVKFLENDLYELRIKGTEQVRIIFCYQHQTIFLLNAFIKKAQKTPSRELKTSRTRRKTLTNIT